jgi:hypothetical protein
MDLVKFLNLCGLLFGAAAAFFLSKVLFAGVDDVLHGTYHYSHIAWPSVPIIAEKAAQKGDTLASVLMIFLTLALQISVLFVPPDAPFMPRLKSSMIVVFLLVGVVTMTVHFVASGVTRSFETGIRRQAATDYLKSRGEDRSSPLYGDVEAQPRENLVFRKQPGEANPDFVMRFAGFLNYAPPASADFSKFR